MNTCFMNKRRRNYFGFNLPKNFVYGAIDRVEYITNGNAKKDGTMKIYIHNGNGWVETNPLIKTSKIAMTVMDRYGEKLREKNENYKDSMQSLADAEAWRYKTYGRELGARISKPYDATAWDAKYRVAVSCRRERRLGL